MNKDELKMRVTAVVDSTWPQFQKEHPALAQVIDQTMLADHVVESLAKDEAFQKAYEQAIEAKVGARAFSALLSRFASVVIGRLT